MGCVREVPAHLHPFLVAMSQKSSLVQIASCLKGKDWLLIDRLAWERARHPSGRFDRNALLVKLAAPTVLWLETCYGTFLMYPHSQGILTKPSLRMTGRGGKRQLVFRQSSLAAAGQRDLWTLVCHTRTCPPLMSFLVGVSLSHTSVWSLRE